MLNLYTWGEYQSSECISNKQDTRVDIITRNQSIVNKSIVSNTDNICNMKEIHKKNKEAIFRSKLNQWRNHSLYEQSLDLLIQNQIFPSYDVRTSCTEVKSNLCSFQDIWMNLPDSVCPMDKLTKLPSCRMIKKQIQVENMLEVCIYLISAFEERNILQRLKIVEFCCGTGFIGLPLAALYPQHNITLIDCKVLLR